MMTGVVTVGLGLDLSGRVHSEWQPVFFLIGIGIITLSILCACWGYYQILAEDTTTLILARKGIRMQKEHSSIFVPWIDIESIKNSPENKILLQTQKRIFTIQETFLGISNQNLATEMQELQRKILLGVI